MIKILIADDHVIVCEGLKQIVSKISDIVVADEASSGQEVIANVSKNEYDVIVMDISMPGRDGIDVLKQVKSMKPNLGVLILSMHPEDQFAVRALKAGASGYINKSEASAKLIAAIRRVSSGQKYVSSSLAEKLASDLRTDSTTEPFHEKLSDREYQVLRMIASGKTPKRIARELSLSVKTISTYRARILEKMNMKTNAELILYAIRNRLVECESVMVQMEYDFWGN